MVKEFAYSDKEVKKEREVEREISENLNLNYGMRKALFMSWKEYQTIWKGKNQTFQDYMKDKTAYEKSGDLTPISEYEALIYKTPLRNENCLAYRRQMMRLEDREPIFCASHNVNCSACLAWMNEVYYPLFKGMSMGVDLFNSGI